MQKTSFQAALNKELKRLKDYMGDSPIYYWESNTGSGSFRVENDELAKSIPPRGYLILYKESDSSDGLPFIEIK